ncbi:MAG: hypothetical protein JNK02_08020 [Planctomycetes bacterium]|nr:hypothetical protein [Planctomycetota bacterium]
MKSFFTEMNLARGIILLAVLGCLILGVLGWKKQQQLDEMKDQLASRIEPLARDLMQSAQRHTVLSKSLKDDSLGAQADLETYIRKVAAKDKVEIGNVNMTFSNEQRSRNVVDRVYRIKSDARDRSFQRLKVANFLYTLEYDSRRVKVTDLKLEVAERRLKPHEVPEDSWFFEAEVTSRQRVDG